MLIQFDLSTRMLINVAECPEQIDVTPWGNDHVWVPDSEITSLANPWHLYKYNTDGSFTYVPPAGPTLQEAQQAKINEINQAFVQALTKGFISTADGTSRTYAIDPVAMSRWMGALGNINAGNISSVTLKDISGNKLTLTASQFKQMANDGYAFYTSQEQRQWIKNDDQVPACKTVADVDAIGWPNPNPPSVPTGLTGTAGTAQVSLSWTANNDVTMIGGGGYNVYQNGTKINSSLVTGTTYTAAGLTVGTSYSFAITAVDTDGLESTKCTAVNVTSN